MGSLVQKQRDSFKVSQTTRDRVERRLALASRPYVARRRNFAPMHVKAFRVSRLIGRALCLI
jgi:hypothetical protein